MRFKLLLVMGMLVVVVIGMALGEKVQPKKPLTLEESINIAIENNLKIKDAAQEILIAAAKLEEAKSAARPTISLEGGYTRVEPLAEFSGMTAYIYDNQGQPAGSMVIPGQKIMEEYSYDMQLSLKQLLYTYGKIEEGKGQARNYLLSSKYGLEKAKQEVIYEVKEKYYGVLTAQRFLQVAEESVAQVEEHLKLANTLFEAGTVPEFDVLRVEVQLANVKQKLISAKNAVNLAKAAFNSVLGIDLDTPVEIAEATAFTPVEVNLRESLDAAYKQRPEILQLETNIEMGKGLVRYRKAEKRPNLVLINNYNRRTKTAFSTAWSWNAVLALSFPIFSGGAAEAKIDEAEESLAKMKNGLEQLKQGIALEVRQAYLSLKEAEEKIAAAAKGVEQAKESLRIARVRYQSGVAPSIELTDAQVALTQAETFYVQALYAYEISKARLEKATGKPYLLKGVEK